MALTTKPSSTTQSRHPVLDITALQNWDQPRRNGASGGALLDSAWQALQANRMRSFLTMLGMIIGVSAVIAITTLTQGVNENVRERYASLGTNVVTVIPGAASVKGVHSAAGSRQSLTLADAQALIQIPYVANLSPVVNTNQQVVYSDQNWNTQIRGVSPDYATIQNLQMAQGSWFGDVEEQLHLSVAVLGQTVVSNLFSDSTVNPIGQTIRIGPQLFKVIGVLQQVGTQGTSNADDIVYIPFSSAELRFRNTIYVDQVQIQVDSMDDLVPAQIAIITLLRQRHNLKGSDPAIKALQQQRSSNSFSLTGSDGSGKPGGGGGAGGQSGNKSGNGGGAGGQSGKKSANGIQAKADPDDFQVINASQLVQSAQQNANVLTVLLVGVAAISLTIGGIGIMNIMLVTVSERVREIGVRLAVGARQRDIRNQFLLEALSLSILGGLIGLVIGLLGGFGLTTWLRFPFLLSALPVLLAFGVSATVGIVFGYYPAVRASMLDPITALRTE